MLPENKGLQAKLAHLYGQQPLSADQFGRREATPAEIARLLSEISDDDFRWAWIIYPPSDADLEDKSNN